jgi:hypothetical protein
VSRKLSLITVLALAAFRLLARAYRLAPVKGAGLSADRLTPPPHRR